MMEQVGLMKNIWIVLITNTILLSSVAWGQTDAKIAESNKENKVLHLPLITHHEVRERRRRELGITESNEPPHPRRRTSLPDHQQIGTLYQGYGTHYVDLWVGTPPQRQTVIVDTGSQLTAFPCHGCKDCGDVYHTDYYFDFKQSSTFYKLTCDECQNGRCQHDQCHLGLSYQEGSSWSAFEARDTTYCGGLHDEPEARIVDPSFTMGDDIRHASAFAFDLVFGCQISLTGLFKTQLADGIMGMSNEQGAFWKQMAKSERISRRQFSLCFSRQPLVDRKGTLAGSISLGGRDERLSPFPPVFTRNIRKSGFFTVELTAVYLWDHKETGILPFDDMRDDPIHKLNVADSTLNSGGVIVDSGTTDTYFTKQVRNAFDDVWKQITGNYYSNDAVSLTDDQLRQLPTILFQLKGHKNHDLVDNPNSFPGLAGDLDPDHPYDALIAMPPSHYMEYDADADKYLPRFYMDEFGGSVLGANFMMGHDVFFDEEGARIGFAESECDYLKLINGKEKRKQDMDPDADDDDVEFVITPFAHPDSDEGVCIGGICVPNFVVILFGLAAVVLVLKVIVKAVRRVGYRGYAQTEEYTPSIELSSEHGMDMDDIGSDEFMDPEEDRLT